MKKLTQEEKELACKQIMEDKPVMVNVTMEVRDDFTLIKLSELNKTDGIGGTMSNNTFKYEPRTLHK